MTLGKKLQLLRKARGMSQEQLAEELDVSRQAVSKWELDATLPDTANVVALSKIFGVTTDYLLVEENEEPGRGEKAYEAPRKKVDWKMIVGVCMAGFGAAGWFIVFVASRFVEVMVPRVEYINDTKITTWDSSITDIDFGLFVKEYHLIELLIVMAVMIVVGVVIALWDKYIGLWFQKLREKANSYMD